MLPLTTFKLNASKALKQNMTLCLFIISLIYLPNIYKLSSLENLLKCFFKKKIINFRDLYFQTPQNIVCLKGNHLSIKTKNNKNCSPKPSPRRGEKKEREREINNHGIGFAQQTKMSCSFINRPIWSVIEWLIWNRPR